MDRLLELLVKKGVVTPEEASELLKEVSGSGPESAVPTSPANTGISPKVNINGYVKIRAEWTENGDSANNDTYRIRQARVAFYGESVPGLSYKLNLGLERTAPVLLDAVLSYGLSPELKFTAGQFKIPLSRESLQSGKDLDLMERAWFLDQFRHANARDVGLKLAYRPHHDLNLEIGTFNGTGKNTTDTNDQPIWVGRLSGKLKSGRLRIEPEIAYLHAPSEDGANPPIEQSLRNTAGFAPYDKQVKQWGLAAFHSDFSLKYEYIQGRFKPQNSLLNAVIADGMYVQLGAALSERCTGFLRFENYDPDLKTTTSTDTEWTTLGLKFDKHKNLNYKLNYAWRKEAVTSDDNDRFGLEMVMEY
ncbi:MAG: porin [bacterium]